jgi:dihydrofolate reductase
MARLSVFNNVSLDGYFTDAHGDMSWAHREQDEEMREFVAGNAAAGGVLVFGRVTYQMMESFWTTPQARQAMPEVARRMNQGPKVVFSRTLGSAPWANTTLVRGSMEAEVARMKAGPGPDMVVLGSGSVVAQLAAAGLVDEFQSMVIPVALGAGRTLFQGASARIALRLLGTRAFGTGSVLLRHAPA